MERKDILLKSYNLLKYKIIYNSLNNNLDKTKIYNLREAQNYVKTIDGAFFKSATIIFKSIENDKDTTSYSGYDPDEYEDTQGFCFYMKEEARKNIPEGNIILKFKIFFVKNQKKIEINVNYELPYIKKTISNEIEPAPIIKVEQLNLQNLSTNEIEEFKSIKPLDEDFEEKMKDIIFKYVVVTLTTTKLDKNFINKNENYIITVTPYIGKQVKFWIKKNQYAWETIFFNIFNYNIRFIKKDTKNYIINWFDNISGDITYFERLCY